MLKLTAFAFVFGLGGTLCSATTPAARPPLSVSTSIVSTFPAIALASRVDLPPPPPDPSSPYPPDGLAVTTALNLLPPPPPDPSSPYPPDGLVASTALNLLPPPPPDPSSPYPPDGFSLQAA